MNIQAGRPSGAVTDSAPPGEARARVAFWSDAGKDKWFAKDLAFDVEFRDRFAASYSQAVEGALPSGIGSAEGSLALALLLDQYPRNSFRGTPWMYATDPIARLVIGQALALGHWDRPRLDLATFLLLPFGHSDRLEDQERSVTLAEAFLPKDAHHARHHRDVIRRFGRFPIATPSSDAPRRSRRRPTSPTVATRDEMSPARPWPKHRQSDSG
ncbi:DUF924 family protein [Paracoccus benzoatiresistens]|uniref:DUF924 family protein n=1 Tax=Paracoccus benzoatiresistens TaxID=2997341 RepID=A0ABT4JB21_9RHOB|nr:DUF924 family protein [Paracoccus sp. EF6]MCZ0963792.1 DUF924 family protein [Paracoccus sp. EF6]